MGFALEGGGAFGHYYREMDEPSVGLRFPGMRSVALDRKSVPFRRMKRSGGLFLLTILIPMWLGCPREFWASGKARTGERRCTEIVLRGEVAEKQEWRAAIGEGWEFRVLPIVGIPEKGSQAAGYGYSGWDLAVDREQDGGYPDALLLATPPYGSLNPRELGTTYGMRAQDAIAWTPRRFRFFTAVEDWKRARELYRTLMRGAGKGAGSDVAGQKLLGMVGAPEAGFGVFEVVDSRLVAGVGDPPVFARQWAANLGRVAHTLVQSEERSGGAGTPLGELKWIRFRATLTLPRGWKFPSGVSGKATNCAE